MSRRVLLALALGSLLAPASSGASDLSSRLDAALAHRALRGSRIAALVVLEANGQVLYARDPERTLVPASNQKLLTSIAALSTFGPAHRFTTEVFADAPPDGTGAVNLLAVRGGGDPALTSEDVWRLAADLRRRGLRRVRGGILLDDSAFDADFWHPSWGAVSARAYHAPVGALSVNYGAFAVAVSARAEPGGPARVSVDPPVSLLRLTNRTRTGQPSSRFALAVERRDGGAVEEVLVSGVAPAGAPPRTYHRSVADPTRYAGAVLRMQLEANGIAVEGGVRRGRVPETAVPLLEFEGRPLADVVRLLMKYSNNAIGESLVKSMGARATGRPGSWSTGIPAVRAELARLGLDTRGLHLVDGSGLSYENRVAPSGLVGALRFAASSFRFGPEFVASLPIAGADGTLEERAAGADHAVRAKTGLLTRVTGLSGFARLPDGSKAVFSVLVNGFRGNAERAMAAVDGFAEALVAGGQSLPSSEVGRREERRRPAESSERASARTCDRSGPGRSSRPTRAGAPGARRARSRTRATGPPESGRGAAARRGSRARGSRAPAPRGVGSRRFS